MADTSGQHEGSETGQVRLRGVARRTIARMFQYITRHGGDCLIRPPLTCSRSTNAVTSEALE